MFDLLELLHDARRAYNDARGQGHRELIPMARHTSDSTAVRMSSLLSCSLAQAFSKKNYPYSIPEVAPEHNPWKLQLFEAGEYTAMPFQEALLYHAKNSDYRFQAEVPLYHEDWNAVGVADGILTYPVGNPFNNEIYYKDVVIEFKVTGGRRNAQPTPPRESYALQTIAYMLTKGISQGAIVVIDRMNQGSHIEYTVWHITLEDEGNVFDNEEDNPRFIVRDNNGSVYNAEWNSVENLNKKRIEALIQEKHEWMAQMMEFIEENNKRVENDEEPILWKDFGNVPINDPLNDSDNGWECISITDRGAKSGRNPRPPSGRANCEWATQCHPVDHYEEFEFVEIGDRLYEFPELTDND